MVNRKLLKKVNICFSILLYCGIVISIGLYTGRFTIIDTGGAIAAIGQQHAQLREEPLPEGKQSIGNNHDSDFHYRVWKKGEHYIVDIPISYAPARYSVLNHICGFGHSSDYKNLECGIPKEHYSQDELAVYPTEHLYAELTEGQYERLFKISKIRSHRLPDDCLRESPDLHNAEQVLDIHGYDVGTRKPRHPLFRTHIEPAGLPRQRTWYNQCLRPVSWVAEVVDIPLSLIATPIGWVVDAVYEPIAN